MARIKKSTIINAPAADIFRFFQQPTNLPEIWPSLVEVKNIERLPNGGTRFQWTYKMAGVRLEGTSEDAEVIANQRVVNKSTGGIESTQTWTFQAEYGGTKVTVENEYTVPIPVLGKLAEAVLLRQNEKEAEVILANLKAKVEG